nr:unnamed protein product [Callosobruchus chinensis]
MDRDQLQKQKGKEREDRKRKATEDIDIGVADRVYRKNLTESNKIAPNFNETPHLVTRKVLGDVVVRDDPTGNKGYRRNVVHLKLTVRPYIPSPIRCFNCQALGHAASSCIKEKLCPCGIPPHEGVPCQDPKECVNCGGPHSAAYRECPSYITEATIQKVKVVERISYVDAKRKVIINTPKQNTSYAAITSKSPEVPVKDIIASLIPHIETAVRNAVASSVMKPNELGSSLPLPPPPLPPSITSAGRIRSDSASTSISVSSDKRKKQGKSTTDEDIPTHGDSSKSLKKRGRPKT